MEDNFDHEVKNISEKVFYTTSRQITQKEGKHCLTWMYNDDNGIPFVYKALSMDPIMRDHFVLFAIDTPADTSLTSGCNSLPCMMGMLVIDEENPSPRIFNLEGH